MVFIPSTCARITSRVSSTITSRVNSWTTSRVSSRIWHGAIWCVRHLRADTVVWLSHTSSVWPWSGAPKVRLDDTFLGGLRHLLPRMKNQHCSMREKNHIGKKIVSQLSVCDVAHVWLVWKLTTKRQFLKRVENLERYVIFSCHYLLILLIQQFLFCCVHSLF